ncbi:MAG: hypothetical protein DMG58_23515 [Acidobacteria bacterium]|nr:MAG: hypothetical protein DMG12_25750 [Acidobacteriota bacterium]PYT25813.1 MAG: hypothetical protein DMG58_23515 [Acidobacteriota bacterium]
MTKKLHQLSVAMPPATAKSKKKSITLVSTEPLTSEEIALYKQLPALTLEQVGRILQKRTVEQVYEMTRARAARPLPVFRSGKELRSTWGKIQEWIEEGFAERAA